MIANAPVYGHPLWQAVLTFHVIMWIAQVKLLKSFLLLLKEATALQVIKGCISSLLHQLKILFYFV